jgi:large conductance mechanosensitive channel
LFDSQESQVSQEKGQEIMSKLQNYGTRGWRAGIETLGGFRKFILRGNVVDLAVGIIIGAAFTGVVTAMVEGLITPLIGVFGNFDFSKWVFSVNTSTFQPGKFVNAVISFLIVAAILYFVVVLPITKLQDRFLPKKSDETPTRECPYCLSSISVKASRCAYCTSEVAPGAEEVPVPANQPQRQTF